MHFLLSLALVASPEPAPRATRIAQIAVTAPIIGGLLGAAGYAGAVWATRPSGPSPWATRLTVGAGWAAGVALGVWLAGLRAGSTGNGWWALAGSFVGAGLSMAVWAAVGGRAGDAAGAPLLVVLPIFSSTALYEAHAGP